MEDLRDLDRKRKMEECRQAFISNGAWYAIEFGILSGGAVVALHKYSPFWKTRMSMSAKVAIVCASSGAAFWIGAESAMIACAKRQGLEASEVKRIKKESS